MMLVKDIFLESLAFRIKKPGARIGLERLRRTGGGNIMHFRIMKLKDAQVWHLTQFHYVGFLLNKINDFQTQKTEIVVLVSD